jgi:hypothetical protein
LRRIAGLALALALGSCAAPMAPLPLQPVAVGAAIQVDAEAVPMDPTDPGRERIGNFTYAGGLALTSRQTSRLHGLSDLKVSDRKSTRLNSSHNPASRMPSSA